MIAKLREDMRAVSWRRLRTQIAAWIGAIAALIALLIALGVDDLEWVVPGVTLVGALMGAVLLSREAIAEREEEVLALLRMPIRRVAEFDARDVGTAPEAPEALAALGAAEDLYLPRELDDELDLALAEAVDGEGPSFVVVSGPSKAGKTRTLFEAVRRTMPAAALVVPRSAGAIQGLVKPGVLPVSEDRPLILWLDDLERYARTGGRGLTREILAELEERRGRVVILATAGGKGLRLSGPPDRYAGPVEELLSHACQLRLDWELSPQELAFLEAVNPEAAKRVAKEGIGAFMIAGHQLEEKLLTGSFPYGAPASPHGQAVAFAVIDWHRCGIVDPIPREALRRAYEHSLDPNVDPSDEQFAAGLDWAREPIYSTVALVSGREELQAYDYIVSFVETSLERKIPLAEWRCFFAAADPEQALALAGLAAAYGEFEEGWEAAALEAFQRAAQAEDAFVRGRAELELMMIYTDRHEDEKALASARRAEEAGLGDAPLELAAYLRESSDKELADRVLREAEEAGNGLVALVFGVERFARGERAAAAESFRSAEAARPERAAGWIHVRAALQYLIRCGDESAALPALRWARGEGFTIAGIALSHLHQALGDEDASLEEMRAAARQGDRLAALKAFGWLEGLGRSEEAAEMEQLIRGA